MVLSRFRTTTLFPTSEFLASASVCLTSASNINHVSSFPPTTPYPIVLVIQFEWKTTARHSLSLHLGPQHRQSFLKRDKHTSSSIEPNLPAASSHERSHVARHQSLDRHKTSLHWKRGDLPDRLIRGIQDASPALLPPLFSPSKSTCMDRRRLLPITYS